MPKMLLFVKPSGGGGGADPYGEDVSLLLHMNGANGSTTFTDSSLNNLTVTRFGNAQISTVQSKYGGAAGYFDGNGDYVTVYDSNAFNFGNGDFTVECWIKPDSNPSPQFVVGAIITTASPTDQQGIFLGITPSRELYWLYSNGGSWIGPTGNPITGTTISDSIWSHIAWVRSGNNTYLYVNGQQIASGSMTGTLTNTNNAILVGGRTDSNQYYAGYIDDLRITKGVARYTSNFTPPTAQFPDPFVPADPYGANVSLLLHMNGANGSTTFTDSSLNNLTVTRFGDAQISTAQAKYGGASGYFDGSGDYLQTTIPDWTMGVGGEHYTIEFWAYIVGSGVQVMLSKHGGVQAWGPSNGLNFNFYVTGTNLIFESYAGPQIALVNPDVPRNQWVHLAAVYDGSITSVYVNGVQQSATSNSSYLSVSSANTFEIGSQVDGNYSLNGYIDDLRVTKGVARYTSNFTPPTAQFPDPFVPADPYGANVSLLLHMNGANGSTTFTDSSLNNLTVTRFGDAQISTAQFKYGGASGYFDGNGDYLAGSAPINYNSNFTVEGWVYRTGVGVALAGPDNTVFQAGNIQGGVSGLHLSISTSGVWNFNDAASGAISGGSAPINQWVHFAAVRNNNVNTLYINGVSVGTSNQTFSVANNNFSIGGVSSYGFYFQGYIDDFRITSGVARYTSNFTPPTSQLPDPAAPAPSIPSGAIAFWKLSDLTDSSPNSNTLTNDGGVQFVSGKVGDCASFDGTNKALRLNSFSSAFTTASPFTISLWYNISNLKNYFTLIGCGNTGTFNAHGSASGTLDVNNAAAGDASVTGFFSTNSWTHFAVARTSTGNLKIWKNGTVAYDSVANVSYGNVPFIEIGNLSTYGDLFALNGKIDSVGIWQRELTQSEIDTLYNSGNGLEP